MSADDLGMLDTFKPFPKTPPKKFPRLPQQPPKLPKPALKTPKRNELRKPPLQRVPLSVRVSGRAYEMLLAVQTAYAARMGEGPPVSQSKAVELMIAETFKRENSL